MPRPNQCGSRQHKGRVAHHRNQICIAVQSIQGAQDRHARADHVQPAHFHTFAKCKPPLENIIRARVKTVDSEIRDRLQNLLVCELEGELARLTHELQVARQGGARLDSDQVSAVETYLAKARALLAGETESNPDTEEGG